MQGLNFDCDSLFECVCVLMCPFLFVGLSWRELVLQWSPDR